MAARAPGRVDRAILDYTTKEGIAIYRDGTKSLYVDGEKKFEIDAATLLDFLFRVSNRNDRMGWRITTIPDTSGANKNLLTEHGELTLVEVQAKAATINAADDRTTQEDAQLYECIMASLEAKARLQVNLSRTKFTVNDEPSGICLLKFIIDKIGNQTRTAVDLLRAKLQSAPELTKILVESANNVTDFHHKITLIQAELLAQGEDFTDFMPHLFAAYRTLYNGTTNNEFATYVQQLKFQYDEGTLTDIQTLMDKVELKYKNLIRLNEFVTPTDQAAPASASDPILAFEALKKEHSKLKKKFEKTVKAKGKDDSKGKDGKGKDKQHRRGKRDKAPKPEWMLKAPADGVTTIEKDGKTWNWCKYHKSWGKHSAKDCRNKTDESETKTAPKGASGPTWGPKAVAALYHSDSDSE